MAQHLQKLAPRLQTPRVRQFEPVSAALAAKRGAEHRNRVRFRVERDEDADQVELSEPEDSDAAVLARENFRELLFALHRANQRPTQNHRTHLHQLRRLRRTQRKQHQCGKVVRQNHQNAHLLLLFFERHFVDEKHQRILRVPQNQRKFRGEKNRRENQKKLHLHRQRIVPNHQQEHHSHHEIFRDRVPQIPKRKKQARKKKRRSEKISHEIVQSNRNSYQFGLRETRHLLIRFEKTHFAQIKRNERVFAL